MFTKYLNIMLVTSVATFIFTACTSETSRAINVPKITVANKPYYGEKLKVSIGKFDNKSAYNNGIFADGKDRLGNQAQTILTTSLQQSGRFLVLDRTNLKELKQETNFSKTKQNIQGARYVITGDVVEFGRKTSGDHQLFGILGKGKTQVAYAKINLNVIDVSSSAVVFSSQGAGEFALSNREVIGFGGTAGYDATLNDKVLSLAINEAVNNLAMIIESNKK